MSKKGKAGDAKKPGGMEKERNYVPFEDHAESIPHEDVSTEQLDSIISLFGDGDMRASIGVTLQYLQNFEISSAYNAFLGDAEKGIGESTLKANPYVDRDYVTLTFKYNL